MANKMPWEMTDEELATEASVMPWEMTDEELASFGSSMSTETPTTTAEVTQPSPELSLSEDLLGGAATVAQGLTFGFSDEMTGAVGATVDTLFNLDPDADKTWGTLYDEYTNSAREIQDNYKQAYPIQAAVLEGAGMVVSGIATGGTLAVAGKLTQAAQVAARTTSALQKVKVSQSAAKVLGGATETGAKLGMLGAGEGALYGFGTGRDTIDDRIEKALEFGTIGAAAGAGLGIVGSATYNGYKAVKASQAATDNRIAIESAYSNILLKEGDAALNEGVEKLTERALNDAGLSVEHLAIIEANAPLTLPKTAEQARVVSNAAKFMEESAASNTFWGRIKNSKAVENTDKVLGQMRTRMGGISPTLKRSMDNIEADSNIILGKLSKDFEDLKYIDGLNADTQTALTVALRRGDRDSINNILKLHGESGSKINVALNKWLDTTSGELYEQGVRLGMFKKGEAVENHFPASVKQGELDNLRSAINGGAIPKGIIARNEAAYAKHLGVTVQALTAKQKDLVRTMLGQGKEFNVKVEGMTRPGFTRSRDPLLDNISTGLAKYYDTPLDAFNKYLHKYADEVAFRENLGLNKLVSEKVAVSKSLKKQGKKSEQAMDVDTDIRMLLEERVDALTTGLNTIDRKQAVDILEARYLARQLNPHKTIQAIQNLSTTIALGHLKSAALQVADVTASLFHNGIGNTAKVLGHSIMPGKANMWKTADLGLDNVLTQDLAGRGSGVTRKLADGTLKWSSFRGMDKLGKFTHINALHNKFTAMAKNDKAWANLTKKLQGEFTAEEMVMLRNDFMRGKGGSQASNLQKQFMFSHIMDRLPVSRSNMPEAWARNPNLRWAYQLKSFGLQQVDLLRRNVIREAAKGNVKDAGTYLLGFTAAVGGSNALVDEARRVAFQDKPMDLAIEDLPDNFMWQSIMLATVIGSPYLLEQVNRQGVGSTAYDIGKPAFLSFVDAMQRDANDLAEGKIEDITQLQTVKRFPLLGDPIAYWLGEEGERWYKGR